MFGNSKGRGKASDVEKNASSAQVKASGASQTAARFFRERGSCDYVFFALVVILVLLGTIMVFSASYSYARSRYGDSYFFARKQLIWAAVGIAAMYFVSFIDTAFIRKFTYAVFLVSFAMMVFVIIAPESICPTVSGSRRWINFPGGSFQPSEMYKFAIILLFADYIPKKRDRITSPSIKTSFTYGVLPYAVVLVISVLVMYLQPHLSGFIIIALLVFVMMFIGETRWRYFAGMAIAGGLGIVGLAFALPHARTRLEVWRDPFSFMTYETGGKGWQPAQSLYAISAGGIFGVGLGNSNQKQLYLPEPQNDYIFPVFCEEFGFVGAAAVIILYVLLIYRGITIAMRAVDRFSRLLAMGIILQIAVQATLNIFVVTNMLPSTGISLPFFSYGGSSMVILMAEMGVLLNISRYSLVEKKQPPTGALRRRGSER